MLAAADAAGNPNKRFRQAIRRVDLTGFITGDLLTPVQAADVTPYRLGSAISELPPLVAVGDAASALDPVSGLGTMKAMDSGLTGAIVIRTALEHPRDAGLALSFHATKERGLATEAEDRIAGFYAEENQYRERAFWSQRSRTSPPPARRSQLPIGGCLVSAEGAHVEVQGVLEQDWIIPAEVVVRPGRFRSGHRFAGIHLAELFRTSITLGSIRRTLEAYPAPEPAVRAALAWLFAEGFLIGSGSRTASADDEP